MLLRNQWRTVGVACLGILASLAGLLVVAHWSAAGASYPAFCGAIGFCVGSVAAKSYGQARAEAK